MQSTYKFRLYPNKQQTVALERDQRNCCYIKNRMIGDRQYALERNSTLGDYCSLYNKQTYAVSALRCNLETKEFGNDLRCSVNRNCWSGDPWRTGSNSRRRNQKKPKDCQYYFNLFCLVELKPSTLSEVDGHQICFNENQLCFLDGLWNEIPKVPTPKRSNYEVQSSALPAIKKAKSELLETSSVALQNATAQVDDAFNKFYAKQAKYPRFKKTRDTGINYSSNCEVDWQHSKIKIPGVGWVKFKNSRQFWEGMTFSKFVVSKDVDQWYISFLVKDNSIPKPKIITSGKVEAIVGGDKGIKKLLSLSGKTQFENPQFYKAEERRIQIRQRRVNRKKKGSNNRAKAGKGLARTHRKVRHRREDYQWKVSKQFVECADANAVEKLNISGMRQRCKPKQDEDGKYIKNGQSAKSQLNKAIGDASWHSLDQKIKYQSEKRGKLHISVDPRYTSQECPKCHHIDSKSRDGEKFVCTECGHADDADNSAGTNIANKAIESSKLNKKKVRVVSSEFTPQIRLRRNHQQRLVSLGSRSRYDSLKLRHTVMAVLNCWIQDKPPPDSKTIASAWS